MKINTEEAYLFGLLIGGGILHDNSMQIILPYKNWGDLNLNPQRAGNISEDILTRLYPLFKIHYQMDVSYSVDPEWKIISTNVSNKLKNALINLELPLSGELRLNANIEKLIYKLDTVEHKKNFITGLVDTVGSLARSHRRFVDDFQIISFEFKGNNFNLVKNIIKLLQDIGCLPDQVLWNHPNQHSGTCRYYNSWKKGFKIRVALDDYMLKGGFLFKSKSLSAKNNKALQLKGLNTVKGKIIKVSGRVTLHKDEYSEWLPEIIRGGHYVHNLHFYEALGLETPYKFKMAPIINSFENYFCPFTCLTKGSIDELKAIINNENYLKETKYQKKFIPLSQLLDIYKHNSSALILGKNVNIDGFPINYILQGLSYIICASTGEHIKGKRVLGSYINVLEENINKNYGINIYHPNKGTCLYISNGEYSSLVGYINNDFNKKLIASNNESKINIRNPLFKECIDL